MDKKTLREIYLARRKALSPQEISQASLRVLSLLEELPIWKRYCYHIFLPIRRSNEVDTYPIVERLFAREKWVVVPRSDFPKLSMQACLLKKDMPLQWNAYDIPEPLGAQLVDPYLIDVIFVPLLIFDKDGYRVGYGKGFYDRFLTLCRAEALRVGLSLFGPIDRITDRHAADVPLDMVVDPERVYRFWRDF